MKVKVSEASGVVLDCMVAKAEGLNWFIRKAYFGPVYRYAVFTHPGGLFNPSERWDLGGPIIEREKITPRPVFHAERTEGGADIYRQDGWAAHIEPKAFWVTPRPYIGPAPLIAAMRCYVASKLGEEVEVPEELLK